MSILLTIYTLLAFGSLLVSEKHYSCSHDQCVCCLNRSIFANYSHIPHHVRRLTLYNNDWQFKTEDFLNTFLKQIDTYYMVAFRVCSNLYTFEEFWSHPFQPTYQESRKIGKIDNWITKCLMSYCYNTTFKVKNSFQCIHDSIWTLRTDFLDRRCFETIKYIYIRSNNLLQIGYRAFIHDRFTDWNVVHLTLDFGDLFEMNVPCTIFQFLTKLRVINFKGVAAPNIHCIIQKNPDLIRISWGTITAWNMCNGSLDIRNSNSDQMNFLKFTYESPMVDHVVNMQNDRSQMILFFNILMISVIFLAIFISIKH